MVLRLIRDLPGDEFLLPPSPRGLNGFTCPVGSTKPPRGLASATDARTTRLRRTLQRHSSCAFADRSQAFARPATPFRAQRCRVHRIPRSTFVTIAIRPSVVEAGWREQTTYFGKTEEIFLPGHLDGRITVELLRKIRFCEARDLDRLRPSSMHDIADNRADKRTDLPDGSGVAVATDDLIAPRRHYLSRSAGAPRAPAFSHDAWRGSEQISVGLRGR